jgi:hypothetical protein
MVERLKPFALWTGVLVVIAVALLYYESDMLWKVQHSNLFLFSSLFFKQQMIVPGGMLSYLGTFFTQFFFYPWMGVLLMCCWWLLLAWATKRAFRISNRWCAIALLPVAILLVNNMDLGYWIYLIKLKGYFFIPTIGTTAVVGLLWAFRKLPGSLWMRLVWVFAVTAIGYPLMGVYALAAVLLMGIWTWRLSKNKTQNAAVSLVALLSIVAVPLLYYRYVYYQTNLDYLYRVALPFFSISEEYPEYYYPYYALAACFLAFVLLSKEEPSPVARPTQKKGESPKKMKPLLTWGIQLALVVAMFFVVKHFWYKDDNFHHELTMQRCIDNVDWEGVLEEGAKQDCEPTRAIVMMHNLALSRLGRQVDEMYNFRKGSKKSNTPLPIYMYNVAGRLIYYHYGLMNECHRMCMEEGVERGWNLEHLKYMARCALFNNEPQAARKYLDMLKQTLFYADWATRFQTMVDNPERIGSDEETGPITHMLHFYNNLGADNGYVEKNLMTQLSLTDSNDLYFQEQALLGTMWTRNPDDFWARFEHYVELHPTGYIPRIFQEAAYLFANMQQRNDIIEGMPFDENVKRSFNAFMSQMQQFRGASFQQLRGALYPTFGNTYYYEYFFLKDITYF